MGVLFGIACFLYISDVPPVPRQVIGQSCRLGEKVFKRGLFALFILRLCAITGVQILLKVGAEVDLIEGIFGWGRRLLR